MRIEYEITPQVASGLLSWGLTGMPTQGRANAGADDFDIRNAMRVLGWGMDARDDIDLVEAGWTAQ